MHEQRTSDVPAVQVSPNQDPHDQLVFHPFRRLPQALKYIIFLFACAGLMHDRYLLPDRLSAYIAAFIHRDGSENGVFWPIVDDLITAHLGPMSKILPFQWFRNNLDDVIDYVGFTDTDPLSEYVAVWRQYVHCHEAVPYSRDRSSWASFLCYLEGRISRLMSNLLHDVGMKPIQAYETTLRHFWFFLNDHRIKLGRWTYLQSLSRSNLLDFDRSLDILCHDIANAVATSEVQWHFERSLVSHFFTPVYLSPLFHGSRKYPSMLDFHQCGALRTLVKAIILHGPPERIFRFLEAGIHEEHDTDGWPIVSIFEGSPITVQVQPNHYLGPDSDDDWMELNSLHAYEAGMRALKTTGRCDVQSILYETTHATPWEFECQASLTCADWHDTWEFMSMSDGIPIEQPSDILWA